MRLMDWGWALLVVLVWGVNFVVIKWGVHDLPPLLLGGLRFVLAALPAGWLIARPALPWPYVLDPKEVQK